MPVISLLSLGLPSLALVASPFALVILAALVLSVVLAITNAVAHHTPRELAVLLVQVPLLAAVGLAFGTPLDTLPFGVHWDGVAEVVHGALALALPTLLWTWLTSLAAYKDNVFLALLKLVMGPAQRASDDAFEHFGILRLGYIVYYLAAPIAVGVLLLSERIVSYHVNLLGLYFVLICLDALLVGVVGPQSFRLRLGAAPLLLVLTVAGAAQIFAPLTSGNPNLDYTIWLKAGLAATVYAFFAALVGRVRDLLGEATAWYHLGLLWRNIKARWQGAPPPGDVARRVMAGFSQLTAATFFAALLVYDLLFDVVSRLPGVVPIIGVSFAAIVSVGVGALARKLIEGAPGLRKDAVMRDTVFDSVFAMLGIAPALLFVLFIGSSLLGLAPASTPGDTSDSSFFWVPPVYGSPPVIALNSTQFWYLTSAHVTSILLVLLTLGQLRYLVTVLWARYVN